MSALCDLVALSLLPVWRWRVVYEQLRAGQPPITILLQHCGEEPRANGRGRSFRLDARGLRTRAEAALVRAARLTIDAIAVTDPAYPAALAAIDDPPPVLWLRGQRAALDVPAVAIVGSRAGSVYALTVAEHLAADLSGQGVTIVSGLARGVDSAAHRGALSVGGSTIAVLGCGVDVVYPREHGALAAEIARQGALVSELIPGTPPHPRFFPQRNRIISGLSRAVVVVEAGEKSGSLITARCALEQGRDVLAVPGSILNARNRGGHALLRDGAKIVQSADDILEELGADVRVGGTLSRLPATSNDAAQAGAPLSSRQVLACLVPGEPSDLDVLAERSGLAPPQLLPHLLELEIHGFVRRAGGGRFVRVDRSC
jgi:DNA processing protein